MPFVQIFLQTGKTAAYRRALGDGVHRALIEALGVPAADHFQVITEIPPDNLVADPTYLGIARTDDVVFVRITMGSGRTVAQKRALYSQIATALTKKPGVRTEDVFIVLIETPAENWSFGNGQAQYCDLPPAWASRAS